MKCIVTSKCIYCGICAEVCPLECIREIEEDERMEIDGETCIGCGKCADLCPIGAISKEKEEKGEN